MDINFSSRVDLGKTLGGTLGGTLTKKFYT